MVTDWILHRANTMISTSESFDNLEGAGKPAHFPPNFDPMPKPNKRIVVFIESTPEGQTIQAFTSVKQLLVVHDVAPYDTIMNHLSRRGGAFVKGDVTIERVTVNPSPTSDHDSVES